MLSGHNLGLSTAIHTFLVNHSAMVSTTARGSASVWTVAALTAAAVSAATAQPSDGGTPPAPPTEAPTNEQGGGTSNDDRHDDWRWYLLLSLIILAALILVVEASYILWRFAQARADSASARDNANRSENLEEALAPESPLFWDDNEPAPQLNVTPVRLVQVDEPPPSPPLYLTPSPWATSPQRPQPVYTPIEAQELYVRRERGGGFERA
mmetsp:Transcript_929/g.3106  ORF Transcript_929/g.3106 Transcript_929/m.3106 type:complete len:210 (+) Transcript_929:327-956(+)